MQDTTEMVVIDPSKTYSLSFLVKNGLFADVRQYSTARKRVLEDLLLEKPILNATLQGVGIRRSILIKGENFLDYLSKTPHR